MNIDSALIQSLVDAHKSSIESNKATNDSIKDLALNVKSLTEQTTRLAIADEVRLARDEVQEKWNQNQEKINEKLLSKIEEFTPIISKAKEAQEMRSRVQGAVLVAVTMGVLALLGFNFA